MRYLLFAFLCVISFSDVTGSVHEDAPPWIKGDFPPKSNDSYTFMISEGNGSTIIEAQKDADLSLISNLMRSAGVSITGSQIERMIVKTHDDIDERLESTYQYEFSFGDVELAFRAVDRYYVRKGTNIEMKTLYEVANNPSNVIYDAVEYTTSYGARGFWRSALIPGWGQMYKKQYAKGSVILVAEAALITTTLIFESQRSSYLKKAASTFDTNAIKFYQNHANTAKNIRNGLIAAIGAVYAYNIVDAIASKGRSRYVKATSKQIVLSPYVSSETYGGLYFSYSF